MDVQVTPLPGIGLRRDFMTAAGRRLGVITHRDGHLDLMVTSADDPDTCVASIPLTDEESHTLADLLGAPRLVGELVEQQRGIEGITTLQVPIHSGSPFDGRTLGDTEMRTRTGVSVVAVVRDRVAHPSPDPGFAFEANDMLVVVGTPDGLEQASSLLTAG